jgi:RNA polymerase sigma-70 factor (ECF subfamily)
MNGAIALTESPRNRFADDATDDVRSIVAAARRGDRAAFATLHQTFAPMVHAVLLSRLSAHDADDLVQEVFVIAMEKITLLRRDEAFGGWLVTIARRCAAHHLRSRRMAGTLPADLHAHEDEQVDRAEAERLLAVIRTLPEIYSETLIMRLVEGMTGPQIAAWTGMTHGSVRINLHRGMALLRERLAQPARDEAPSESRDRKENHHA